MQPLKINLEALLLTNMKKNAIIFLDDAKACLFHPGGAGACQIDNSISIPAYGDAKACRMLKSAQAFSGILFTGIGFFVLEHRSLN